MWCRFLILLSFFLCAPAVILGQQEAHIFGFGGVNNQADSMMIADTDAQDAKNVITDEGDMRTIPGNLLYSVVGSSAISFLGEFIDSSGNHSLIRKSGLSIYASTTVINVMSTDRNIDMVSAYNAAYFVTGAANGAFFYDGTSTTTVAMMADCKYVEYYANRLVCVNTTTDTAKIMLSQYNSSTTWTVTASKDSGAVKYFDKDDGYGINCVKTTPFGLFLGKGHSTQFLKGTDNETFYQAPLMTDVGCVDDRQIQMVDGELVWLSQDGYYAYDGSGKPRPISLEINNTTKNILQSASNDVNWTVNTQAGWELGTGTTGWNTSFSPGNLVSNTYASFVTMFEGSGWENGKYGWIDLRPDLACDFRYHIEPPIYGAETGCYAAYNLPSISILNADDLATIVSTVTMVQGWNSYSVSGSGDIIINIVTGNACEYQSPPFDRSLLKPIYASDTGSWQCLDTAELKSLPAGVSSSTISTSTYYSKVHFTTDDIVKWGNFTTTYSSSGVTPSFQIRTATYAFAESAAVPAWAVQTDNSLITESTGTYVQFGINPNITKSTHTISFSAINSVFTTGAAAPRSASVVADHRYISAVSTASATLNDTVLIWQKNKKWTFGGDVNYGAMTLYNNSPLGGDGADTGKVWSIMHPDVYTFDGVSIDSYWITKDYPFSAINNHKVLNKLWLTAENNGLSNLGVAWQANRDGVWNSTTTSLTASSFIIKEVDGLFETQYPGRQFRFKFSGNELNKYFRLKLFSIFYTVNPLIKD